MADPRYPIGEPDYDTPPDEDTRQLWVDRIAQLPSLMDAAVDGLSDKQLDTPYREGGWTVRQVVHHVSDSHINAHCRFRLVLTEEHPTIRTYQEKDWAELPDGRQGPIGPTLALIRALHDRWARLLDTLDLETYQRTLHHPESGDIKLWDLLNTYQWHGRHHVAHITTLRDQEGW